MNKEFVKITITNRPDPGQVQLGYSHGTYLFPFPISTKPPAEWIEILYDVWRENKSKTMPKFAGGDDCESSAGPIKLKAPRILRSVDDHVFKYVSRGEEPQVRSS